MNKFIPSKEVHFFEYKTFCTAVLDSRRIFWSLSSSVADDDAVHLLLNDRDRCKKVGIEIRQFEPPTTTPVRSWTREIPIA